LLAELVIILVLVLVNGIFSGAEIAIVSMRKTRLAELVAEGKPGRGRSPSSGPTRRGFLATVQIGITVVGATAAAFGGSSMASDLAHALRARAGMPDELAEDLGAQPPSSPSSRSSRSSSGARPQVARAPSGRDVRAPRRGAAPDAGLGRASARRLLTGASNVVLRVFGDSTTFTEARLSKEEIQQIVDEASTFGSLDPHAGRSPRARSTSGAAMRTRSWSPRPRSR
jgi:putative hemolysin